MLSTQKHTSQLGLFLGLADQLDQKHPLYQLANKINWSFFDDSFKSHYSANMGKPGKPIRLMVSLLIFGSLAQGCFMVGIYRRFIRPISGRHIRDHKLLKCIIYPYYTYTHTHNEFKSWSCIMMIPKHSSEIA